MCMERHNFFFPKELMIELKKLSEETGAPMAEIIRRAIKEYIEKRRIEDQKKNE
jgi:predicted DNA-binding protein